MKHLCLDVIWLDERNIAWFRVESASILVLDDILHLNLRLQCFTVLVLIVLPLLRGDLMVDKRGSSAWRDDGDPNDARVVVDTVRVLTIVYSRSTLCLRVEDLLVL